ncbi:hypothetical protein C0J26_07510 [Pseudomonas baetica]|nr:hypothetical protein C0J26_07510 [Pseudomonas baetica]
MERACSRRRCVSCYQGRLIQRIREQARSHIDRIQLRKPHPFYLARTSVRRQSSRSRALVHSVKVFFWR